MAEAIVAVEKTVADLDKRVTAALADLDKRATANAQAIEAARVEAAAGVAERKRWSEETAGRIDANTRRIEGNAEAIARGVARDKWVARAVLTTIHPPHHEPPGPPTPPAEAAESAVPLPVSQAGTREAAERGHELLSVAIDALGGRLTDEEFAAGPPAP
jgi:hypothetical protein